jgi:dihydrofolate reductase
MTGPTAERINAMPNLVASTTRTGTLPGNGTVIDGDLTAAVTARKSRPGADILIYGCGPVATTVLQAGLIDLLHPWVFPVVVGPGAKLFDVTTGLPHLELVTTRARKSGVVASTYRPAA